MANKRISKHFPLQIRVSYPSNSGYQRPRYGELFSGFVRYQNEPLSSKNIAGSNFEVADQHHLIYFKADYTQVKL